MSAGPGRKRSSPASAIQRFRHHSIRIRKIEGRKLLRFHPPYLIVFLKCELSFNTFHPVDQKLEADAVRFEKRGAEKLPDGRPHAELFSQLPGQ